MKPIFAILQSVFFPNSPKSFPKSFQTYGQMFPNNFKIIFMPVITQSQVQQSFKLHNWHASYKANMQHAVVDGPAIKPTISKFLCDNFQIISWKDIDSFRKHIHASLEANMCYSAVSSPKFCSLPPNSPK